MKGQACLRPPPQPGCWYMPRAAAKTVYQPESGRARAGSRLAGWLASLQPQPLPALAPKGRRHRKSSLPALQPARSEGGTLQLRGCAAAVRTCVADAYVPGQRATCVEERDKKGRKELGWQRRGTAWQG